MQFCLLTLQMFYIKFVDIDPLVLEKKMLTTDDDGRQCTAIGHLSGSGDLRRVTYSHYSKAYVTQQLRTICAYSAHEFLNISTT